MGWTKTGEDIRETINERMQDDERGYYGDIYINSSPDYPSRKFSSTIASCVSTTDTALRGRKLTTSTCRLNTLTTLSKTSAKMTSQKSNLGSSKSGYIQRDYEHYGIEIYFYCRLIVVQANQFLLNSRGMAGIGIDRRNVGLESILL